MTDIAGVSPKLNEDVAFTTALQWAGDPASPGTFKLNWTNDNGGAGDLAISADTLSARLVTTGNSDFDAVIVCASPDGSIRDTCKVNRHAGQITAIGMTATVVTKA